MKTGFRFGKTEFIGIEFTAKDGSTELIKPCKEMKIEIEKYFNSRIPKNKRL